MIDYKQIPKVELHVHLDGSVRPETAAEILKRDYNEVKYEMIAKNKCIDLNDYLTKFSTPVEAMQTKESLSKVAYELATDLKNDNVIYAEIRFAPLKHLEKGLNKYEVIESVLEGIARVDIKINLILCMMRGVSLEENMEVIDLAKHFYKKGVCAVDLAGAESIYPTSDYKDLFIYANKIGIPYTIHAGEADGYDSIKAAISFGAKRIGHGVQILEHEDLIKEVKEKDILLEVCPTSNVQTNISNSYKELPIKKIYDKGVVISINTDNRTVSNTNLYKEYINIVNNLDFNVDDIIKMNKDALKHAFLEETEKQELLKKYNSLT